MPIYKTVILNNIRIKQLSPKIVDKINLTAKYDFLFSTYADDILVLMSTKYLTIFPHCLHILI